MRVKIFIFLIFYGAALCFGTIYLFQSKPAAGSDRLPIEIEFTQQDERLKYLGEQLREVKLELADIRSKFETMVITGLILAFFAGVNSLKNTIRFLTQTKRG